MLFKITTKNRDPNDLSFLLHKHHAKIHNVETRHGQAIVFFSEKSYDVTSCCVTMEIDSIGLTKRFDHGNGQIGLDAYVNDSPYSYSQIMNSAVRKVFGTTLTGVCKMKPELSSLEIDFEILLTPVRVPSKDLVVNLFEPLGYDITMSDHSKYSKNVDFGLNPYVSIKLKKKGVLSLILSHINVLLGAIDTRRVNEINDDEIESLVNRSISWINEHPKKEFLLQRLLKKKKHVLAAKLMLDPNSEETKAEGEFAPRRRLNDDRHDKIVEIVKSLKPKKLLDLGCGEGNFLKKIANEDIEKITGVDSFIEVLRWAKRKTEGYKNINLVQSGLTYHDKRLQGYDTATLIEVIEHNDHERLKLIIDNIFGHMSLDNIIISTPNIEYNVIYNVIGFRHNDHRFEMTRKEFNDWAENIGLTYKYFVSFDGAGEVSSDHGQPTQIAIFRKIK